MKYLFCVLFFLPCLSYSQSSGTQKNSKSEVVWSAGLFKSWLNDQYVGFYEIEDQVFPKFHEHHKMGFAINSHYIHKIHKYVGVGIHLGVGLDVNSYIESPVLLFGGTISIGSNNQFLINVGWADAKRRKIPTNIRRAIEEKPLSTIPTIYDNTELNTGFYLGIAYRFY